MKVTAGASRVALLAFLLSFAVLIANGRAIGSGDTNAVERTTAALVDRGSFVLPEDETQDPFTRPVPGGRISIYPALPALLATPFFFLFGLFFDLNAGALQVAGKLWAALLTSAAIAVLAWSFSQRASSSLALGSALLFGLGTSAYSTAQALWQHPSVLLFLVIALTALERVDPEAGQDSLPPALIAAFSLSLVAASRPATIPMCLALFLFLLYRARTHAFRLLAIAIMPVTFMAFYNATFFGAPWRFGPAISSRFLAAFPESIAGLLLSPGRGLFVFTPIALLASWSLGTMARRSTLARALVCAVTAHFLFMATWNEWHGGESFGPRLLTDLLPALFYFLPEALEAWPTPGVLLGLISVAIQVLGGWTYDYRWERLHQRGREFDTALWSWRNSPIAFAAQEGVLIQGVPDIDGRRVRLRLQRWVPFGREGASIEATESGLRISGEALMRDIRLERGARISAGWMTLAHPGDALAFRSESAGAATLRLVGSQEGVLRIETRSGSRSIPVAGDFDLEVPLQLPSGGDVFVRAEAGELRLARIQLRAGALRP